MHFKVATIDDCLQYYKWLIDPLVRLQSFNSQPVSYESHRKWFLENIQNPNFLFLIFFNEKEESIGQVRIQKQENNHAIIGISIDDKQRGKGYANKMLKEASDYFLKKNSSAKILAYIKKENEVSKISFEKAGFKFSEQLTYLGFESFLYIKSQLK
jgi:RimJ/RimL family protein N-acetyltransferase